MKPSLKSGNKRLLNIPRPAVIALLPSITVALLAAGAATCLHVLVYSSAQDRLSLAQQAYHDAKHALATQREHVAQQKRVEGVRNTIDTIWATLPTQDQFPSIAVAISDLAKSVHVSIPGMHHNIEQSRESLPAKGTLTFKALGRYSDMYRLIERIESAKVYFVIESLTAARSSARGRLGDALVEFDFRVVTFLRPETKRAGES